MSEAVTRASVEIVEGREGGGGAECKASDSKSGCGSIIVLTVVVPVCIVACTRE